MSVNEKYEKKWKNGENKEAMPNKLAIQQKIALSSLDLASPTEMFQCYINVMRHL